MVLYLVRHGQSEGNKKGLHQGPEVELSQKGKDQAVFLARRLKGKKIDAIYASPMTRTKQTAEIISKKINVSYKLWDNLKEIRNPSELWGKDVHDEKVREIRRKVKAQFLKGNGRYSDEETFEELDKRAKGALDSLLEKHRNDDVLCISHATMIKMLVFKALLDDKLTPEVFMGLREHILINNTGITVLEYTKRFGWALIHWNDARHLE